MPTREVPRAEVVELRRRAEEQLKARQARPAPLGDAGERRLLHELEIHQIQLEMQNEELRVARLELERAVARCAELYDFAPLGYATVDGDGTIHSVNLACARLLGRERSQLLGLRLGLFVSLGDRLAFHEFLGEALECAEERACEIALGTGTEDGDDVGSDVRLTARSLPGHGILLAVEDVSERRKAEERLREANARLTEANVRLTEADRHKEEFLGILSHELRNPLAPIRISLYVLDRVPADCPQATRARRIIRRQTEHLGRLVNDLLDVTRVSHGKIELRRERVDLSEIALRCCEDHQALFERRQVELRHHLSPAWVDADPTRIAQVLGNLLQNARQCTPTRGVVTVEVAVNGGSAELRVRDTGVGMRAQDLQRLFEPFARGNQDLAQTRGGLGLGLAFSKGLVDLHGGSIAARSDGPGRGSEFCVQLPLAPAPAASAAAPSRAATPDDRRLVLLIEGSSDASEVLSVALGLRGHEVRAARDGRTGIAMAHALRPDVVLCDIGLPDIDGYEVARALRADEALRSTHLIALSGRARPEDEVRAREAGFDAHIAKPAEIDELIEMVAQGR